MLESAEYVQDRDLQASLAVGELTYTRIRACFAFIKHFGLQFGTGGQDNNDTDSGGTAFKEFETNEIMKLRSLSTW